MKKEKGLIHIYTGDGKGKTTSALGLALRAIGAEKKVIILQFLKKPNFSEHKAIKKYKLPIKIESFGIGFYKILGDNKSKAQHQKAAQKGLKRAQDVIASNKYDVVILDEINVAVGFGLIDVEEVISVLTTKNCIPDTILTGRRAHPKLKKIADLVTEMKKIKHPYDRGVKARKGIEF